jgi:hypothetical protein
MIAKEIPDVTFKTGRRLQRVLQAPLLVQSDAQVFEQNVGISCS